jgi:hypothetical protein
MEHSLQPDLRCAMLRYAVLCCAVTCAGEAAGAINSTALNLSLLKESSDESFASQRIQVGALPASLTVFERSLFSGYVRTRAHHCFDFSRAMSN